MPSKPQPRQHSPSRTVKEKALSPPASLLFHDRIKPEVLPCTNGNRFQDSKKGELVKNMSSVPGFLQRADNPQDKILNFGVLDWESLEKYKHTQKRGSDQSRAGADSYAASSSKVSSRTDIPLRHNQASCSNVYSSEQSEKCCVDEPKRRARYDKFHKAKPRVVYGRDYLEMDFTSSKLSTHEKKVDKSCKLESDRPHQHRRKKQDSVILLQPKDFTTPGGLEEFKHASIPNSTELNWNSFSDVFSVEELCLDESNMDVVHSCPLTYKGWTEANLDRNLNRLSLDQKVQLPSDQQKSVQLPRRLSVSFDAQCEDKYKEDLTSLTKPTTSQGLNRKSSILSNFTAREPSLARQFSLGIGRLSRSLSFKEGSTLPELNCASIKAGPAKAQHIHDDTTYYTANATATDRGIGPFKRLLDPIFKPKAAKPVNLVDSSLLSMKNINGMKNGPAIHREESNTAVVQAVLQLTVKSGLPLFKFLVESSNEFLASTVKRLSPLRKDDPSWLYSFYSVEEVKRKSGGWKYQGNKGKSSDVSHKVIGQMKVTESMPCRNADRLEQLTRESVLYGIDLSKVGEGSPASAVKQELGAIVVKNPKEVSGNNQRKSSENKTTEIITPGSTVVILPGAIHSLPSEGVPASLMNRWRTGGLCDCGGWDVGCKLQVLTNQDHDEKLLRSSSGAYPLHHLSNLYLQGAETQNRPTFRVLGHGDSSYMVEYDQSISTLQAFAISVAVLTNQKQTSLSGGDGCSKGRRGHFRSKSCIAEGEGTRYPPYSPVGRA